MAFNSVEFMNDLLKDTNITDDQKTALQSALSNSVVAKRLEEGQLRQSDYSRQVADTRAEITRAKAYYEELTAWKAQEAARLEQERAELKPVVDPATPDFISRKDMDAKLAAVQGDAIGFLSTLNKVSINHYKEFNETLNTDEVITKAREEGTNFNIAYDRLMQPRRDEKQKVDFETRIAKERKEAVAEALANASLPTAQNTTMNGGMPHVLDAIANKPAGTKFGWQAAVEAHTRDIANGTVRTMSDPI